MNVKVVVAILLIAAVPLYAQAQGPSVPRVSKEDAQKVVTIIKDDKDKTRSYCDILKISEQLERAYDERDIKLVDELMQKIGTLEKTIGPEYAALAGGLAQLDPENEKLAAEIMFEFDALKRLCTR